MKPRLSPRGVLRILPNKVMQRMEIPLRFIVAGELKRSATIMGHKFDIKERKDGRLHGTEKEVKVINRQISRFSNL
jgi:hypothetical protein